MRSYRAGLAIIGSGLLTFALVFTVLQVNRTQAAPDALVVAPMPTALPVSPDGESLAITLAASHMAVGLPSGGSESLLLDAQPGDRLDVLASLPSPEDSRPITAVVVSGATVLRPATSADPLLVDVSSADAIVLAHLVLSGTHLVYTVWPAGGSPPEQQSLDERTVRALLDLPPLASLTPLPATPPPATPVLPSPTPTPRPETYTVQAGESLYSVATRLGVDAGALWWANRSLVDPTVPLVAGTSLQVPLSAGFLYQVQSGDTWDSVSTTFGMPASDLWHRNELPENAPLVSGMLLFIPRQS